METAVALVSCLVWRERVDGGGAVRSELQGPLAALREAARRIGKVQAPDVRFRVCLHNHGVVVSLAGCSCALLCMA